jgi:hypothetical protein
MQVANEKFADLLHASTRLATLCEKYIAPIVEHYKDYGGVLKTEANAHLLSSASFSPVVACQELAAMEKEMGGRTCPEIQAVQKTNHTRLKKLFNKHKVKLVDTKKADKEKKEETEEPHADYVSPKAFITLAKMLRVKGAKELSAHEGMVTIVSVKADVLNERMETKEPMGNLEKVFGMEFDDFAKGLNECALRAYGKSKKLKSPEARVAQYYEDLFVQYDIR